MGSPKRRPGECVFSGKDRDEPMGKHVVYCFRVRTRDAVAIMADARRLLGYRRARTTNRYVHLNDGTLSQAAEWVAVGIYRKLCDTSRSNTVGKRAERPVVSPYCRPLERAHPELH